MSAQDPAALSPEEVQKVARLSRLQLSAQQVELYRVQLTAVLRYADRLRGLDLSGVEPMPHIGEAVNRLDADEPGQTLSTADLMKMAPDTMEPFIRVPKVFGEEGER